MDPTLKHAALTKRRLNALFAPSPHDGCTFAGEAAALITRKGSRAENQDRAFVAIISQPQLDRGLFVAGVLDGMGGMKAGGRAASIAASRFLHSLSISSLSDTPTRFARAISAANADVWAVLRGAGGATLTAVAITDSDQCFVVHAGDSRLYRANSGVLDQVTGDDTLAGLLGGDDPNVSSNELMQFVGIGDRLAYQTFDLSVDHSERLLLTTDGFHEFMDGRRLAAVAGQRALSEKALMRLASGPVVGDNATAITIHRRNVVAKLACRRSSTDQVTSTTGALRSPTCWARGVEDGG